MIYKMAVKVVGVEKTEGVREGERETEFRGQLEVYCTAAPGGPSRLGV